MASANPLSDFLAAKKLTQQEFSRQFGFPEPTVSTWVSGGRRPNLTSALRLQSATRGRIKVAHWPHLRAVVTALSPGRAG